MKVNLKIRKTTKREKVEFIIGFILLLFAIGILRGNICQQILKLSAGFQTTPQPMLSAKNCGMSIQAVDKYKNGVL